MDGPRTRRDFLRLAAGAAAAATAAGCSSGSDKPKSNPGAAKGERTLRIAQWNHYVAGYDQWWDNEYTRRWGERNGIEVVVDHLDINQAPTHAETEVATQRGHDIFHFLGSPAAFEDEVIDHREIVEEVEAKFGKIVAHAERSTFNPKTDKWFAFSDGWWPGPVNYRSDLWDRIGRKPNRWEDVLAAASSLKAMGHPIGIAMSQNVESTLSLASLMHAFGASIQDEDANVIINGSATVEAVKAAATLFRVGMTDEIFGWDIPSNNRFLASGRGSLIMNGIAALRAIETQDADLAARIELLPVPAGPAGRLGPYAVNVYVIWRFSQNQEAAKQFLVDLVTNYREAFIQSQYLQLPSFPGAVKDLSELVSKAGPAQPAGKYGLLAEATEWTTNLGHPGYAHAAIDEIVKTAVIPRMFAAAARGEMSAEDAVRAAEAQVKAIFEKWRERGKI